MVHISWLCFKVGVDMKRFYTHILCVIAVCIVLVIVRSTRTIDYASMLRNWKMTYIAAASKHYEQTRSSIGREFISQGGKSLKKAVV